MAGNVGRPRKQSPRRRGSTAREEILDASAELFTTQGFATTSTHQIADAVGIRQASLYYHFPSKTEIFLTLLNSTVEPSIALAEELTEADCEPAMKLWALVAAETRHLLSTRWNLGRLYQLPMAASEDFVEFHEKRTELYNAFTDLAKSLLTDADDHRAELPFYIAQSVTEMRPNDGAVPEPLKEGYFPELSVMLADAALAVLNADLPVDRIERALVLVAGANMEQDPSI
ncbi:MAG: TetR/AcrR family transcriptional regulator [Corynebacterium sp.]|nr:TetR/AcrR family transcriptional regulator [Corynebacterium sp.]